MASEQVEANGLEGRRVFVLPFSLALSDAEARALRAFVEKGGVLLADGPTGLVDEHVNWRASGALDELFGIAGLPADRRGQARPRTAGALSVTAQGAAWGLKAEALPGLLALEPQLKATTGQALVRIGGAEAVIVRQVGAGWTVYLNQLLDGYGGVRGQPAGEAYRVLAERVLAHAGIRPAVSLSEAGGRPLRRALVSRYRFGDADVVAVLDGELGAGTRYGADGVTRYTAPAGATPGRDVVVRLPRAAVRGERAYRRVVRPHRHGARAPAARRGARSRLRTRPRAASRSPARQPPRGARTPRSSCEPQPPRARPPRAQGGSSACTSRDRRALSCRSTRRTF